MIFLPKPFIFKRILAASSLAVVFAVSAWAQQPAPSPLPQPSVGGQINQHKPEEPKQHPASNKEVPDQVAPLIKESEREKAQKEARSDSQQTPKETPEAKGWGLSDKIAAGALIAAILQFASLVWTIREMRLSSQRELRAYVFTEGCDVRDGSQVREGLLAENEYRADLSLIDLKNNRPVVFLTIKNSGQTPAYKVGHWTQIHVTDKESDLPVPVIPSYADRTYMGVGGTISKAIWFDKELSISEIEEIRSHKRAIYVTGRIEYIDAFRRKHFTTYRIRYSGIYPPAGPTMFSFCQGGNETDDC